MTNKSACTTKNCRMRQAGPFQLRTLKLRSLQSRHLLFALRPQTRLAGDNLPVAFSCKNLSLPARGANSETDPRRLPIANHASQGVLHPFHCNITNFIAKSQEAVQASANRVIGQRLQSTRVSTASFQ